VIACACGLELDFVELFRRQHLNDRTPPRAALTARSFERIPETAAQGVPHLVV
jgi:hypothetical protein